MRARHRLADRRPGITPGRRSALMLAVIAGLISGPAGPALAGDSSSPLVVATVYGSSGTTTDSVTVAALQSNPQGCPNYSGPNTMNELGRQGWVPVQLPGNATWALSTILRCLQTPIPPNAVKGVTVINADGSPEEDAGSQLSPSDLASPSDFNNTAEQPVVEALGSLNQYDRPWRGSQGGQPDDDYLDEVQASQDDQPSPIAIEVFEGPLLTVTVTASETTVSVGATVGFSATVTGQNGAGLSYSWSFDGGAQSSTAAAPRVQFNTAGQYDVTVQVTDTDGGGGYATVPITVGTPPAPAAGSHNQTGAGTSRKSHTPTGPKSSSGTHAGAKAGNSTSPHSATGNGKATGTGPTGTNATTTTPTPSNTTAVTSTVATSIKQPASSASRAPARTTTSAPARSLHATQPAASRIKPPPATPASGPLVAGQLVSDVTLLPAGVSPLAHDVTGPAPTAPPARRAIRASILPGVAAGFAVIVLLGLGAGRELRGGRGRRAVRFGS